MPQKISAVIPIRPLSPHLGIYRWQITMVLSILHRATGMALAFGTIVLVTWLCSAAYSPDLFAKLHIFCTSIYGKVLLIGWSYAFFFHLCNGVRHLFWDIGKGFEIHTAARTGWAVVIVSILATTALWYMILTSVIGFQ